MQFYQKQQALGSNVELSIVTSDNTNIVEKLYHELWNMVFQFERQFSRFIPASELSVFNRNAGMKQAITPAFRKILEAARAIGEETRGLYNPFILPALQAAGYTHSLVKSYEHDAVDDHSRKTVVTIDHLEIGDTWARIPYGTALDLGGCGKGYLADELADFASQYTTNYWFSLGGDIIAQGTDDNGTPWRIAVQDGLDDTQDIGWLNPVANLRIAAASSGTRVRHGTKRGKAWHHLIDPRSLEPATTDILLVTVCATSCFRADVLASCTAILGSREGPEFLKKHGITIALLQHRANTASELQLTQSGAEIHIRKGAGKYPIL